MNTPSPTTRISLFDDLLRETHESQKLIYAEYAASAPRTHGTSNTYKMSSPHVAGVQQADSTGEAVDLFCARTGVNPRDVRARLV